MEICHVSSAHGRYDIRIFKKECCSLAKEGYRVYLIINDNKENEYIEGVEIISTGYVPRNRFDRMANSTKIILKKALEVDADIYHLHDPELLTIVPCLKKKKKKVIFDSHEDVPAQIVDKQWVAKRFRKILAKCYEKYQTYIFFKVDALVAATPHIAERISGKKTVTIVNNYPILDDIIFQEKPFSERGKIIGYAGSLDENRGKNVVLEAMQGIDGTLYFASKEKLVGDKIVNCGVLDRNGVNELYKQSRMGIVLYMPLANHVEAQPIKLFEYMAAGLPVVASNFPLWQEIVVNNSCGICVDPCDVSEIQKACNFLLTNLNEAEKMGKNGRLAVEKSYSWRTEEITLLGLYQKMCSEDIEPVV